ncbi:MAG: PRC-barrel domain-containing protein [Euryarchaeota archaeon]|nr:PRC-barrel domain-containing protein [Euryarchaeota archaeon]
MAFKMSDLYGMDIFSETARYIGKVEDIALDARVGKVTGIAAAPTRGSALTELGGKKGVIIPYNMIIAIGDIVLIRRLTQFEEAR